MCAAGVHQKNQELGLMAKVKQNQYGPALERSSHLSQRNHTQILPCHSIPSRRTLRSDITAAPFHARRIKTGSPFQVYCQNLRPLYCV